MGIRWQIQFKSILGTSYVLSIYDASYSASGTITQLIGGESPFVTSEDEDQDIYKPIRNQSGYIRFIAENTSVVGQMMPSNPIERPVVLKDGNGNICWAGFLSNEQYSQNWEPCPYEVEIPVVSIMTAMKGVEFTKSEGYTSLMNLIITIDSYLPYTTDLYLPSDIPDRNLFVNNNNFREFLTIPERSERGTSDKYECKYIYDCMEEFCKYFGVSLHEYNGSFYFVTHNAYEYEDVDLGGHSQQSQWGSITIEFMTICGTDNQVDYSQAFRRIIGTFELGKSKAEDVFSIKDSFFKLFSVQGAYPTSAPVDLLFYGNSEILPYKDGIQQTSWIDSYSLSDYGGQIIRHPENDAGDVEQTGVSWNDYFLIHSQKSMAGSPSRGIVFNVPNYIYINSGEYTALNISCNVSAWFNVTQSGDFIKRLHCKVKVGNYWLKSEIPSTSPDYTNYTWTTTESTCWLLIDNGNVTMKKALYTLNYHTQSQMEKITGFAIDMPSGLSAGYHAVYMELICNNENTADFGEYAYIRYLVSNIQVRVLRAVNSLSEPTPDFDSNKIIRFNDIVGEDYSVDSIISTKRGTQFGTGAAVDSNRAYITTKYDELGIVRRTLALSVSKEILSIDVRKRTKPIDYVTVNNADYNILSQSMNWRDDVNRIKIRKQ